jgi:hypothetical protein
MSADVDALLDQYRAAVERSMRGGLLDAEVDRLMDEQARIVQRLRKAVAPQYVRELIDRPWIEVRP